MQLFSDLHKEGATVVVVTHEENIAAFTDRIVRFQDGVIISDTYRKKEDGERSLRTDQTEPLAEELWAAQPDDLREREAAQPDDMREREAARTAPVRMPAGIAGADDLNEQGRGIRPGKEDPHVI